MLAPLRALLFKKALRDLLVSQKRSRQVNTLESARTIGVLFDATSETARRESLEFVRSLEKQGKKVSALGFFNGKQAPENQAFDSFFAKETSWLGQPKSEKANDFVKQKFDLLLTLNPDDLPPLEWLAAKSQSAFKVGFATSRPNDFDVQLETPEGKGIRYFTEQLALYLGKIVLN
ncbi:MAG: hypothetical protein KA138_13535 [Saprospiraceae bacterium]|nr:hypothetical protein [Lewinellaceae bacterium]MBP6812543.1 hypothetical protein [Saprospiraceae bacterium]